MRRLVALTSTLLCLVFPAGIAYGACNSTDTLDRELDREALTAAGVSAENDAVCRQNADSALVTTASTRQYDPSAGRFIAVDPLETRNQIGVEDPYVSSYLYANNRPGTMVDPSGEVAIWVIAATAGTAAAIIAWQAIACSSDAPEATSVAAQLTGYCAFRPPVSKDNVPIFSGSIAAGVTGVAVATRTEEDQYCAQRLNVDEFAKDAVCRIYDHNPKHGRTRYRDQRGKWVSRMPHGGPAEWQKILDNSISVHASIDAVLRQGREQDTGLPVTLRRHGNYQRASYRLEFYHGFVDE